MARVEGATPKWLSNCLVAWVVVTGLAGVMGGAVYQSSGDLRIVIALIVPLFIIGFGLMVGLLLVGLAARSKRAPLEMAPRVGTRHDKDIFRR